MPAVRHFYARSNNDNGDIWFASTNNGARWAYFAIIIAVILVVIFCTIRANKRRLRIGKIPLRGTAWMTPPLYYQSQNLYNQPREGGAYVPPYSATGNATDVGYYNNDGTFVSYVTQSNDGPKFQPPTGAPPGSNMPVVSDETGTGTYSVNPQPPQSAHVDPDHRGNEEFPSYYGGRDSYELGSVARPAGPPPGHSSSNTARTDMDDLPDYTRPEQPMPVVRKN
ncbi:hypothetical protein BABINDRAFT_8221 [Babjeviella inositovora NRRL Y-12698]|uniref:Protein RCR2 n=1 Tax=Babjeviella inositovora NRRL Y-12698 TaxID=984486 RepID=A0A1E3QQT2_9ASCO|nr:uncharacterized protein BABINDRAFT_8221 [Babjeviella inositovora NRRL Y-12698]ODQ80045.1 hypothetical protein BABINDRAFT_8221 [Babjeviella inositovora NRRL Y-12698]